jgi:hypothetical protein
MRTPAGIEWGGTQSGLRIADFGLRPCSSRVCIPHFKTRSFPACHKGRGLTAAAMRVEPRLVEN